MRHPTPASARTSDSQLHTDATSPEPSDAPRILAALIDASDAAVIAKTLDNTILSWNRGAARMYGYTAEEAVGRSMTMLQPRERAGEMRDIVARIGQGERIEHLDTARLRKDGQRILVSLVVSPIRDDSGNVTGALTVARDTSGEAEARRELRKAQSEAKSRSVVLETANRVALNILADRTGIEALAHIAEAARSLAGARYAALGVARADGQGLSEFVTTGLSKEAEAAIGPRPIGAGVLGELLHRTEPLRIDRLGEHPASVGFPPHHPPMDSFLGVPIRRGDSVLGSLYLTNKLDGSVFTEADVAAVEALGAYAAVAIHNMQMIERQRALVRGLMFAQEEERRAVAYDLHDGLTQYVMASHAHFESFKRAHEQRKEERAARELENGLRYLKEAVVESRRLVSGLRSLALDDLGLAGSIEQLLAEEKARAGWDEANIVHNIADCRFDRALETAVYRVAQEAITNVRKHAEARRVQIALLEAEDGDSSERKLFVDVRDDGKGFVPEERTESYQHVGLNGMIERVRLMGGALDIHSAPGEGTAIHATFPALDAPSHETTHEGGADGPTAVHLTNGETA